MTIREALAQGIQKLLKSISTSPELDAEVLLGFVLKKNRSYISVHMHRYVRPSDFRKFKSLINRRFLGIPIAYLTGHKEFFGLDFIVNKNVLIPRPETEILVELVLEKIKNLRLKVKEPIKILDIGTGSGCIIISLAYNLNPITYNLNFFASDISQKALMVAKQNAKRHRVRIQFKQANLLRPWKNKQLDIIVANLPYLAKETDPSTKFEPKKALLAKKKGLALFEELFKQVSALLSQPNILFLEIGHNQGLSIKKLTKLYLPNYKLDILKDLSGRNRIGQLTKI